MRQIHVLVVVDLLPLFAYGLGHIMSVHVKVYLKKGYLKIHPFIIIFLMISWGKSTIFHPFPPKAQFNSERELLLKTAQLMVLCLLLSRA